ncbi:hypothetical protein COCSUDRAFT_16273 [Coccomyxa subellipsoidea C-169]|uniref:Mediator of RNA polymerase II transcription subunit 6 n=1 Tax=Coccomyxa subellipsoidea (strain C-169) TaxID=574566 RepID=I0YWJ1_COCSC|nr:hypothetical protein COCSUDRAFT_16273 [Coccomyxa subellipsoidea C-169]EIE22760.1 hypothetical protein COCSUDRAFT_16273 [Coccomyxa subellipsoidea C-169]|eukprot:XP_005647304.1 hypothetical protein COCSUDRAFT_16273 [Coccomyxa subellipsoidea C-169]
MAEKIVDENFADELAQTTWRDDAWLAFYPLNVFTALDYFALSPFYDRGCNNELAKLQGGGLTAPVMTCHCARSTLPPGVEYELQDAQEPHLFIIRKQHRSGPKTTATLQFYYILDGNVYQAPSLHAALSSRIVRHPSSYYFTLTFLVKLFYARLCQPHAMLKTVCGRRADACTMCAQRSISCKATWIPS